MKSLMSFWQEVAHECATWCGTSTTLDFKKLERRVEHEGFSFLGITLPNFGKDLEKGLDQGCVTPDLFAGFQRRGGLPLFLGGFLELVFDRGTGLLLDDPSIEAIRSIRQLTLMFGKVETPCSQEREDAAFEAFVQCEKEVKESDATVSESDYSDFRRVSSLLFSEVFSTIDRKIERGELQPSHGPGATADKLMGNQKFVGPQWTERLERIFPFGEYALPSYRHWEIAQDQDFLEPGAEIPVKVISVPKTLKTPRIIAIEPTAMQYMQQALRKVLYDEVESNDTTRHFIGFTDALPNQEMAREGSSTGRLATIDLSEASDRVSNQLVREMVSRFSFLAEALDATRSRKADVPGHGVIRLAKFASMGSAVCFPIEAMVFTTLVFLGIERQLNRPLTHKDIKSYVGQVRVYGDDIIVPVAQVQSVIDTLHSFGSKVNVNKSFWTGKFRESCGGDYYDGHDVTVVRVRRNIATRQSCDPEIVSTVGLRNNLYWSGRWRAAHYLDTLLQKVLRNHYPVVSETSQVLGRHSVLPYEAERMCSQLHAPLVKGYVAVARPPRNFLGDVWALHKCLSKDSEKPFEDERHLERSGRPKRLRTKLGWFKPF